MATQTDHGKRKGRGERVKIEVGGSGGGGIIVIGCALIGVAIGAAFVAHRGRDSNNRGRRRKLDQEEEKGLQSLLPSADRCGDQREMEASSVDSQESASEKSEIGDAIESDEGSEGTGYSSIESGAEVVWPSEEIERQKEFSSFEVDEMKQISVVSKNHREDKFSFDSTVQIQETTFKDSEIINQIEAGTADTIDDNIAVKEFSFWTVKSSMPEIQNEHNLAESEIVHVPEEGKLEPNKDLGEFCIEEEGEKREKGSEIVEASSETNEMKQQLEISEKTEDVFVSESEDSSRTLQNLLPTTNSIEQQKGHVSVDSSEGTQNNASNDIKMEMETSESLNTCDNFEVVVETRKNHSETYMNADNNLVEESDISHVEEEKGGSSINSLEEIELQVENVGEKEKEESKGSRSSVEFSDRAVFPADVIEQGKMDGSLSTTEMKDRESLFKSAEINMLDNETDETLEDSAIAHEEIVKEEHEDTSVKSLEEEIRSHVVEANRTEGSIETENSPKEFDGKGIWPAEAAFKELSEVAAWPAKLIEQEEPPSAVTKEMKQEEDISEKMEDIFGSEAEDNTRTLQNLIPSTGSIEQEKGHVLDTLEENQGNSCNGFKKAEMVVEAKEKPSEEADTREDNGIVQEPYISHEEEKEEGSSVNFQEEIEFTVEDAGEKGEEGPERSRNSSVKFDDQAVLPADASEQEKMDGSMSITEMKHQLEIPKDHEDTNLDAETEGSQNTCKKSEVAMEIEESQLVPNIDHGDDIAKECSYDDMISNISQEENKQDFEESDTSREEKEVENGSTASQEAEIESSIEEDGKRVNEESEETRDSSSQTEVIEKEEGLALVENEMKLQFEIAKKAKDIADIGQAEMDEDEVHEQEVLKKEADIMVTDKEKRKDFILTGSSKVFLLVLALTLALGLLAFARHDHLHNYKRRLPEIYRQLNQLFFPSHNGAMGEL